MGSKTTHSDQPRKRFFLQYSLRGLLIATALVGVGLVVFRWPFTTREVFTDPLGFSETRIQTFRRNWDGSVVKHGLSKFGRMEEFYIDGVKVWEAQYAEDGRLRFKQHFLAGRAHGPYYDQEGKVQGQFDAGLKTGMWRVVQSYEGESVIAQQSFDAGIPHGEWKWSAGETTLQSATFDRGRLTKWNGRPPAEEMARILELKQVDPVTRDVLATRMEHVDFDHSTSHGGTAFEWPLTNSYHRLVLQFPMREAQDGMLGKPPKMTDPGRSVSEAFVEQALLSSQTLDFRFGVICFVPITQFELHGEDRSGVSQIRFEPGSREEQAWLEPISVSQDINVHTPQRLQQLFAGTPIEIDASKFAMPMGVQPAASIPSRFPGREFSTYRRPRRDVVGLLLLARGWTLQQRGNRLEIIPRSSG